MLLPTSSALISAVRAEAVCRWRSGVLIYLDKSMQADRDVGHSKRLHDPKPNAAGNNVAWRVLLVRIIRVNLEVDEVARFR